MAPSSSG